MRGIPYHIERPTQDLATPPAISPMKWEYHRGVLKCRLIWGNLPRLGVRGARPTNWAWWRNCPDQVFRCWLCPVMAPDRVIRWTTAVAVIGVAAVAAVASYEHAYDLVRAHGEAGWTARLVPLTVDGLIYASSMAMLDSARRKAAVPALARWLLGLGIAATLAANVAHGLGHGLMGAAVAAWPAVALVGSYELLMMIIRSAQLPGTGAAMGGAPGCMPDAEPLQSQAAQAFAVELAAGRVPSVRAIRARLHVGQPRAQRVRAYLAALDGAQAGMPLEHRAAIAEIRSAA